ncbi:hypothetical protein MO973_07490 [Paenibacillus sp. TRM 82003]|nr:hypothetical protein [Paenibacillus sp. TRM 82003]
MVTVLSKPEALDALRSVEGYGYQVAYYLLGDERLSTEATSEALVRLGASSAFYEADADERREAMKRAVMRASLAVRRTGRTNASSL